MRIALRPSGGRGDYELAGSDNGVYASDLLEKQFYYQITPSLIIAGKAKAHRLSGKPRIRPEENGIHPYVVIYSVLLLPPPRRELIKTATSTLITLSHKEYILYGIDVDLIETDATKVIFAPTNIWAKSQGGILKVDFTERMAVISMLWATAKQDKSELGMLIQQHQAATIASDHSSIQKIAEKIRKKFEINTDVLPLILREFKLPDYLSATYTGITDETAGYEAEDSNVSPQASLRERIRKWRKQADRGPDARKFSMTVREAYDYRCLFSGERFPKLKLFDSAGVDGAHILPWSTHELNSVRNGICLCKQCHWGFDNGLLRLDFDSQSSSYSLSIPKNVEDMAIEDNFDLACFQRSTGVIDRSRLPVDNKLWPSPKYIQEFNSKFSMLS
jgi:HNH endonuclease